MTPIQIEVLLHHYYCVCTWAERHQDPPSTQDAIQFWVNNGCLAPVSDVAHTYDITERGNAMVRLWIRQELPTQAWVDSNGEIIEQV